MGTNGHWNGRQQVV